MGDHHGVCQLNGGDSLQIIGINLVMAFAHSATPQSLPGKATGGIDIRYREEGVMPFDEIESNQLTLHQMQQFDVAVHTPASHVQKRS